MTVRTKQVLLALLFWFAFAPIAILGIVCLPVGVLLYALGNDNIRDWVYRCGKALDQFDNALIFGGLPQETISSHTGRWVVSGRPMPFKFQFVYWLTDLFEEDHAVKAIEEPFEKEPL
jgi:hypothetical protein